MLDTLAAGIGPSLTALEQGLSLTIPIALCCADGRCGRCGRCGRSCRRNVDFLATGLGRQGWRRQTRKAPEKRKRTHKNARIARHQAIWVKIHGPHCVASTDREERTHHVSVKQEGRT
jgi:hypothetical protein